MNEPKPCGPTCQGHVTHPCEKCGVQWDGTSHKEFRAKARALAESALQYSRPAGPMGKIEWYAMIRAARSIIAETEKGAI